MTTAPVSALDQFCAEVADDLVVLAYLHSRELTAATLARLKHAEFPKGLSLILDSQAGRAALELLDRAMAELTPPFDDATLDSLAVDFANIYLLYAYRASPYESVWLDDEQLERQQPMFEVSAAYRRHGLMAASRRTMPDDHLSLQLEFIAHLLRRTAENADLPREAADFMDYHLLRWLDRFAKRVVARSQTPFYAGLAALTSAYCDELRTLIAMVLDQPRPTPEEIEQRLHPLDPQPVIPIKFIPGATPSW